MFTKKRWLAMIGLAPRSSWILPGLIGVGVGALLGCAGGMLLAPRSGSSLRGDLARRGRRIMRREKPNLASHIPTGETSGYSSRPSHNTF